MDDTFVLNIAVPSGKAPATSPAKSSKAKWMEKKQIKADAQIKKKNEKRNQNQYVKRHKNEDFETSNDRILQRSKKISKRPMNPGTASQKKIINVENQEAIMKTALDTEITEELFSAENFQSIPKFNPKIASALEAKGFTRMTEIQRKGIPAVMRGKNCLIKSETGSGKTLAYMAPIFNNLSLKDDKINRDQGTFCMIICPTRELCIQVVETANILLKASVNIVVGAIMGGESIKKEKARIRKGITILVATPGRLIYHMKNTESFNYNNLKYMVFEESDRTLDMGFKNDLEEIIGLVSKRSDYEQIQKILISANFTEKIESLWLKMSSKDCAKVGFSKENKEEENYIADCKYLIPKSLSQQYIIVEERRRLTYLLSIILFSGNAKIIIFVSTCDEVEFLEMIIKSLIYKRDEGENEMLIKLPVYKLHGKIEQKIRTDSYLAFKKAKEGIMLSTDVASRGLDFEDVKLIIQLDPPQSVTDYVNRMGRTARIGHKGLNLLFLTSNETGYIKQLEAENIKVDKYEGDDYYKYVEGKVKNDFLTEVDGHTFLDSKLKEFVTSEPFYKVKARRAYVSYVRSYARLKEKDIFHQKQLNLMHLAKAFGLLTPHAGAKEVNDRNYSIQNFQKLEKKIKGKKKRRATASNVLEKLEFV